MSSTKDQTIARAKRTEAYANKIREMFSETVSEIASLTKSMPELKDGQMFSFETLSFNKQQQIERLLRRLRSAATLAVEHGVKAEWEEANRECDELVRKCLGTMSRRNAQKYSAWMQRNTASMNEFMKRSEGGMKISDKIWKSVQQLREEMEVAITVSIGDGTSASSMTKDIKKYLNDPDLMFRRFRYKKSEMIVEDWDDKGNKIGEHKEIVWGRKWKKRIRGDDGKYHFIDYDKDSYKPGQGVYKSAYKNAMRVARTETNTAYRRADNERWKQLDFVVGQRIQLSKQHPKKDICDKLAGDYPKDFIFEGWHPQCYCFCTPILVDDDEMARANQAALQGKKYTPRRGVIRDYPENFKKWVKSNKDNIVGARARGTEPYFLSHNSEAVDDILGLKQTKHSAAQSSSSSLPSYSGGTIG